MPPALGLILTSAPDIPAIRAALVAARADTLKIVPAWGLPSGWTQASIAEVCRLTPRLIIRTSWGDPSYAGGARSNPEADQIAGELTPWLAARPDAIIEIGNEPLIAPQAEDVAWRYLYHLDRAIAAVRAIAPRATILGPAQMINHQVALGPNADGVTRWLAMAAPTLRRCDGLSLHAYSGEQLVRGLAQLRRLVSASMPVWLTEFALNEALAPAARAQAYRDLLADAPVEVACLYHLNQLGGTDPVHHNPNYDLDAATLAALGAAPAPAGPVPPHVIDYPGTYHQERGGADIRMIVIHATAGTNSLAWLASSPSNTGRVSAHALVSKAGDIYRIVPDRLAANHCGYSRVVLDGRAYDGSSSPNINQVSLGVELENRNDGRDPYPDAQLAALAWLITDWRRQHGELPLRLHREIDTRGKSDPAGLEWPRLRAALLAVAAPDPWEAWGTAHPLPVAQRSYGIPRAWLAAGDLGAATTPELAADGYAARVFARGVIVWYRDGNRVETRR
jgi:N-acetyl-anhydromuramyl-L-alanine amidase AmpD